MTYLLNLPIALARLVFILLVAAIVMVLLTLFAVSYGATWALVGLSDWLKNENKTR